MLSANYNVILLDFKKSWEGRKQERVIKTYFEERRKGWDLKKMGFPWFSPRHYFNLILIA
jgi:hypothetical protein